MASSESRPLLLDVNALLAPRLAQPPVPPSRGGPARASARPRLGHVRAHPTRFRASFVEPRHRGRAQNAGPGARCARQTGRGPPAPLRGAAPAPRAGRNTLPQRLLGHQQVTDAYLLSVAATNNAVLLTFESATDAPRRGARTHRGHRAMTSAGSGRGGSGSGSVAGANRERSARAAVARTGSLQYDRGHHERVDQLLQGLKLPAQGRQSGGRDQGCDRRRGRRGGRQPGQFDVVADGELIFSKQQEQRFPEPDEVVGALRSLSVPPLRRPRVATRSLRSECVIIPAGGTGPGGRIAAGLASNRRRMKGVAEPWRTANDRQNPLDRGGSA